MEISLSLKLKLPTCKYEAAGLEAEKAERREKLDGC